MQSAHQADYVVREVTYFTSLYPWQKEKKKEEYRTILLAFFWTASKPILYFPHRVKLLRGGGMGGGSGPSSIESKRNLVFITTHLTKNKKLFVQIKKKYFQQHLQIVVIFLLMKKISHLLCKIILKGLRHRNIFTVLNFHFEEGSRTRRWRVTSLCG
jgi:hypothetical protein